MHCSESVARKKDGYKRISIHGREHGIDELNIDKHYRCLKGAVTVGAMKVGRRVSWRN